MYVSTNFRFWYVCSRLFLFPFSPTFCSTKFVCETLCKFLYFYASLKCIFMQSIMVNRKLFGNFEFSCTFAETFYLFTFYSFVFLLFWIIYRKRKQKRKSLFLPFFAVKCPFLSQITYWFSEIYTYIGQTTPHPPLLALAGWVSSLPKIFYFFYFLFFVKYYDFINFAFLPNFEHFPEYHIYFFFCIKFHSICF